MRELSGQFDQTRASALRRQTPRGRVKFESLELRIMLSANALTLDAPAATAALAGISAETDVAPLAGNGTSPTGYTPAQIAAAYGFNNISFGNLVGNGAGQTIAIIDAYDDPNISSDLQKFDAQFGLPNPTLTKIIQKANGQAPAESAGWSLEISLDVEWAHAMAPGANIELIEANTATISNLLATIQYAASQPDVSVVSMSWGAREFSSETSYNSYFTTPSGHTGVTFVASSGDSGAGVLWPAISTNVLAVGGTSLNLSGNSYSSETAWSGSGGGKSLYQAEASYQQGVQTSGSAEDPDVAYDANPYTGFAVYDSIPVEGYSGWIEVGGTSAGSPQWSALVAIADQGRVKAGENTLSNAAAAVYMLPAGDFHDITSGSNGAYTAGPGYDEVTGLGSPKANLVAQGLLGVTTAQQTYSNVTASTAHTVTFNFESDSGRGWKFADLDDLSELVVGASFAQAAASRGMTGSGIAASTVNAADADITAETRAPASIAALPTGSNLSQSTDMVTDVAMGDGHGVIADNPLLGRIRFADAADLILDPIAGIAVAERDGGLGRRGNESAGFLADDVVLAARLGLDPDRSGSAEQSIDGVVAEELAEPSMAMLAVGLALAAWLPEDQAARNESTRARRSLPSGRRAIH